MIIQHNIMALNAHRQLGGNNSLVQKNLEKLSSGYKINRAGDDAAGLAISEKMRAQITGLTRATSNAQDGISLVQTAEGALTEVHSMLNRMVDLSTQSANGTLKDDDRQKIQDEMNALTDEIDRISKSTNFNGINLLDGSLGSGTTGASGSITAGALKGIGAHDFTLSGVPEGFEVDIKAVSKTGNDGVSATFTNGKLTLAFDLASGNSITQDQINAAIRNAAGAPANAAGIKVEVKGGKVTAAGNSDAGVAETLTAAAAKQASTTLAVNGVTVTSTKAGNIANTIKFDAANIGVSVAANGNVTVGLAANKDYTADEINAMLMDAGVEMRVSYDGTRKADTAAVAGAGTFGNNTYTLAGGTGLATGGGLELQIGDTGDSFNKVSVMVDDMGAAGLGIQGITVGTQGVSDDALADIKKAINKVSTNRSAMGALQNRLEHTINNLGVATENMTAAESRIRDVDMAKEMMHFTKNNVLSQAAQAMLAQANQQPQQVLQLLR